MLPVESPAEDVVASSSHWDTNLGHYRALRHTQHCYPT